MPSWQLCCLFLPFMSKNLKQFSNEWRRINHCNALLVYCCVFVMWRFDMKQRNLLSGLQGELNCWIMESEKMSRRCVYTNIILDFKEVLRPDLSFLLKVGNDDLNDIHLLIEWLLEGSAEKKILDLETCFSLEQLQVYLQKKSSKQHGSTFIHVFAHSIGFRTIIKSKTLCKKFWGSFRYNFSKPESCFHFVVKDP